MLAQTRICSVDQENARIYHEYEYDITNIIMLAYIVGHNMISLYIHVCIYTYSIYMCIYTYRIYMFTYHMSIYTYICLIAEPSPMACKIPPPGIQF